jgi:hypothetical protein
VNREKKSLGRKSLQAIFIIIFLPIVLPLAVVGLILYSLNKGIVYLLVWLWWLPQRKDVLFVSSESPIWKEYMETQILPLIARRAITLNWTARREWPRWSFTVWVFRTLGGRSNFNPMVVLFRPFRRAMVLRFFSAFKDWKHGNTDNVDKLRRDLIAAL